MDHLAILKRVWHMLWRYRALWVFGIILALTVSSGGGASNSGAQFSGGDGNGQGFDITPPSEFGTEIERLGEAFEQFFESGNWALIPAYASALILALCCLGLLVGIIFAIARYVSETSVIRMVDAYEATGETKTVRQGFQMGWSRAAWRLFLIGLVVTIPIVIGAISLFAFAGLPLLAWTTRSTAVGIFGTVASIGFFFLALLAVIIVAAFAHLLVRLAWRAASLDELGIGDALRRSWALIKGNWKDVGLMWLIMLGINLGYGILMIPVVLILLLVAGVAGGLVFGALWALIRIFATGALPWIVGAALGAPVFLVVMSVPLVFAKALHQVYQSGVWTLTYRELRALETLAADTASDESDDHRDDADLDAGEDAEDMH